MPSPSKSSGFAICMDCSGVLGTANWRFQTADRVPALGRGLSLRGGHALLVSLFQRAANMIPAHDSPLAALAFDASGTKLATASEKVSLLFPGGVLVPRRPQTFSFLFTRPT